MRVSFVCFVPLALVAAGCTTPVAAALDEADANTIVLALDRVGIDSIKEPDPASEGKFRVDVPRDDAARALAAMRDEDLPKPRAGSLGDAVDKGGLVPSQAVEHAQIIAGTAGELQRTLEGIEGVLSARVHLNVPLADPFHEVSAGRSSASVLLSHRGTTPPLAPEAVQRIVAGGIANLAAADVAVVMVPRGAPIPGGRSELAHVGPIAVARGSLRLLQAAMAGAILLFLMLASLALVLVSKLGRARAELDLAFSARGANGPSKDERR